MSWLPAMMFMHMLNDDELDQPKQADESDDTPIVDEIRPTVIDGTPTAASNSNSNSNVERTPTVVPNTWHHNAMSAATFALSAIMAYVATGAICKRISGRN